MCRFSCATIDKKRFPIKSFDVLEWLSRWCCDYQGCTSVWRLPFYNLTWCTVGITKGRLQGPFSPQLHELFILLLYLHSSFLSSTLLSNISDCYVLVQLYSFLPVSSVDPCTSFHLFYGFLHLAFQHCNSLFTLLYTVLSAEWLKVPHCLAWQPEFHESVKS